MTESASFRHEITPLSEAPAAVETPYMHWSAIVAGAISAAAVSFVLFSFGSAVGLAVASPSSTWRDTSTVLVLLSGVWLLLTALVSFGLGGYLAGHLRMPWRLGVPQHEVEFRDGVHGLLVWGLALILGAFLAFAAVRTVVDPRGADLTAPTTARGEPLAFELDRLFRTDRSSTIADQHEIRAQALRIITASIGHSDMAADDRAYLVRLVETRAGIPEADAERRVTQVIAQAREAIGKARRAGVVLAFMVAASLLLGAAIAWVMAVLGGEHRQTAGIHQFWRRWTVDRMFFIR
jgi:hypothetical protein